MKLIKPKNGSLHLSEPFNMCVITSPLRNMNRSELSYSTLDCPWLFFIVFWSAQLANEEFESGRAASSRCVRHMRPVDEDHRLQSRACHRGGRRPRRGGRLPAGSRLRHRRLHREEHLFYSWVRNDPISVREYDYACRAFKRSFLFNNCNFNYANLLYSLSLIKIMHAYPLGSPWK